MKRTLLSAAVFTLIIIISTSCSSQEEKPAEPVEDVESTILKLEDSWDKALVTSDIDALEKLYADTLIYTHSNGSVDDKATYITKIRAGQTKYESMTRRDPRVKVYGNTAIVTANWDVHVTANGARIDTKGRYIHVYTKIGDEWKMVAHQSTRVDQ